MNTIKTLVSRETLLSHPNLNEPFEIHTEASKLQPESVISQKGKPIAFYNRKLAQVNYTTTERELLSLWKSLKKLEIYYKFYELKCIQTIKT